MKKESIRRRAAPVIGFFRGKRWVWRAATLCFSLFAVIVFGSRNKAEWVMALSNFVMAATAIAAVFFAIRYYRKYREDTLRKNTIDLLSKLESDPVISESLRYLNKTAANGEGDCSRAGDRAELRFHAMKILNCFENISYAAENGMADKIVLEDRIGKTVVGFVKVFVKNTEADCFGLAAKPPSPPVITEKETEGLKNLMKLYGEWEGKQT